MRVGDALRTARAHGASALVPYVLVDRERRARLPKIVDSLRRGGSTAVELGFPFSDPIADGPTLAAASARARRNGTRWSDLLDAIRTTAPRLPCAVMTYANPVWNRGLERALREVARAGATALIVPDLSLEESTSWRRAASAAEVDLVLLLAPGAPAERVRAITRRSRGFLYLVSRYGTTGTGEPTAGLRALIDTAHRAAPRLPVLVGFGVRDRATADVARSSGSDGVIVGTALEERLARRDSARSLERWLGSLVAARS